MAIVVPTNYVLKVYKSEANALSDSNALKVDDSNGAIKNSNPQAAGYGYWTHTKYWYRIEANEPVTEFYIDWDDGEDNDPKGKANYTSIKFDTPTFVGITSHIYTGNSTTAGGYFPKIRCKSMEGYWSKFYQNALGAFTHTGIDVLAGEASMATGRNNTYRIESDITTERIPALYPEIKPPICVLKVDKKRVYAGIDNDMLRDDNGSLTGTVLTLVEGFGNSGAKSPVRTGVGVKVTYTSIADDTGTGTPDGTLYGGVTTTTLNPGDRIRLVTKVLKVELLNLLEDSVAWNATSPSTTKLYPGEKLALVASKPTALVVDSGSTSSTYVYLNSDPRTALTIGDTILTPSPSAGFGDTIAGGGLEVGVVKDLDDSGGGRIKLEANAVTRLREDELIWVGYAQSIKQTVAEVSLGNPIVSLDDWQNHVTYDLTESYARTSEQSISNYYLDDGKDYFNHYAVDEYFQAGSGGTATGETLSDTNGTMGVSSGVTKKSYAFDLGFNFVDEDYRWLPKQILSRGQIKVGAVMGSVNKYNFLYSHLEHWKNSKHTTNMMALVDDGTTYNWPSDMTSAAFMTIKSTFGTDRWTDLAARNRQVGNNTNYILQCSGEGTEGVDIYDIFDSGITSLEDGENIAIFLCGRDSKWTKQFFKLGANNISSTLSVSDNSSDQRNGKADRVIPGGYATHLEANSGIGTDGVGKAQCRVTVMYTGLENDKASADRYMWKPLKIYNHTSHPDYPTESSWYTDGAFEWEEPEDWAKIAPGSHDGGIPDRFWPKGDFSSGAGTFSHSTHDQGGSASAENYFENADGAIWDDDPTNDKKYGLMFLISTDAGRKSETDAPKSYSNFNIQHSWPCSNGHSVIVDVFDPMCVSLNSIPQVQSISYSHKGKYQTVENRLGKADIRKIGSSTGSIKFGGIDMPGETTRTKYLRYQNNAVPVYLDVSNENGDITRFFGTITSMSRDHPTGKMKPKLGLQMTITHIIIMDSTGTITSDGYISLGGSINEPKYI